jgi:hypothetical protein
MKKYNKKPSNKPKMIKQLAEQFQSELDQKLPITVLPDGSSVFKGYLIKKNKLENWGLYHLDSKSLIEQFYLKTTALMGAKAYSRTDLNRFFEIKRLDNRYWANYCDTQIHKQHIKTATEFDRYLIILNKLEDSQSKEAYYKEEISKMFKWSFV